MKKKQIKELDYNELTDKEMLSLVAYNILRFGRYTVEQIIEYKQEINKLDISHKVKDYLYQILDNVLVNNIKK